MAKELSKDEIVKGLKEAKYNMVKYVPKSNAKPDAIWNSFKTIATIQEANKPSVNISRYVACALPKGEHVCAWKSGGYKTQKIHMKKVHKTDKAQPKITNSLFKHSKIHIPNA